MGEGKRVVVMGARTEEMALGTMGPPRDLGRRAWVGTNLKFGVHDSTALMTLTSIASMEAFSMCKSSQFAELVLSALLLSLSISSSLRAQDRVRVVAGSPNNQMRVVNAYPEYWVDAWPFFQDAATFHYYRLPRDRRAEEMVALKDMGLNTLDIPPMWNWHEPEEGQT